MKIILLVDLSLNGTINAKPNEKGVALRTIADVCVIEGVGESSYGLSGRLSFLVNSVLEVAAQTLDLLDLLGEIGTKTTQGLDDVGLDILGLVGLGKRMLVVVGEEACGVLNSTVGDEDARLLHVLDDIRYLHQRLATVVVGGLNLAEIGDERLEKGTPCLETICQYLCGAAVSWNRRVQGAIVVVWGARLVDMNATSRQAFPTSAALQAGLATDAVLLLQ